MAEFQWGPENYLSLMHEEIPDYERLQDEAVAATGEHVERVLELGTGTGETARRLLERHSTAVLVGVDESESMLAGARRALPSERVELLAARVQEPLPEGRYDLVVSTLVVHHLDAAGKADLFHRIAESLAPGGRFVLADLVVPEDPADVVTPIDGDFDTPSSTADQLSWLAAAGLHPRQAWAHRDLAVLIGQALAQP